MDSLLNDIAESLEANDAAEALGGAALEIGASVAGPLVIVGVFAAGLKIIKNGFNR